MRLTTFLILATLLQLSASTYAQKVTLKYSNVSLKFVLKELNAQTGYSFLYTETQLKNSKPVTIQVRNIELSQALKYLFSEQPLTYEIENKTIVIREKIILRNNNLVQQKVELEEQDNKDYQITGVVLDTDGQPLANATVAIPEYSSRTTTDARGIFSIKVTSINFQCF